MVDSVYWIWMQMLFGIGTRRAELFMNYFDNPQSLYKEIAANGRARGMLTQAELQASDAAFDKAVTNQRRTLGKGCDIITPDSPDYPPLLQQIYAKPAALYVKGDLTCLSQSLPIAMVGTRTHSDYGKDAAKLLATGLAESGAVIVSGLARGIDTFCHQAALDAGGKTVGILGCGIDYNYPAGSAPLKSAISKNGAVVSEFPLGSEPLKPHFPIRNRVISGMCRGVVVVEADHRSGSIITAGHAIDQGREVFAVPGSIFTKEARGTHELIRDGAHPVECAGDILQQFGYPAQKKSLPGLHNSSKGAPTIVVDSVPPPPAEIPEGVSEQARRVLELLAPGPAGVDALASDSGLDVARLQTALTELEIYGLAENRPGRIFARCAQIQ